MYVRMTFFKVKDGKMDPLRDLYNKDVIPAYKSHKGIRFVHLPECLDDGNEGISVTTWDTKAHLDAYEASGDYERLRDLVSEMCSATLTRWAHLSAPGQYRGNIRSRGILPFSGIRHPLRVLCRSTLEHNSPCSILNKHSGGSVR